MSTSASRATRRSATYLGIPGHDDSWSDYSPSGLADQIAHVRHTIAALHSATPGR